MTAHTTANTRKPPRYSASVRSLATRIVTTTATSAAPAAHGANRTNRESVRAHSVKRCHGAPDPATRPSATPTSRPIACESLPR